MTPPPGPPERVTFGATVQVRGPDGIETFRIVGVDETDAARNWISLPSVIRVFLIDDHPIVRRGLAALLSDELGLEVCGQAENGVTALQAIEANDTGRLTGAVSTAGYFAYVWTAGASTGSGDVHGQNITLDGLLGDTVFRNGFDP